MTQKEADLRILVLIDLYNAQFKLPDKRHPQDRGPWWNEKRGRPQRYHEIDAVNDMMKEDRRLWCLPGAKTVMVKAIIDLNGAQNMDQVAAAVYVYYRTGKGDLFWEKNDSTSKKGFKPGELKPGDQVWFENPYSSFLTEVESVRYRGDEGSNVFYVGGGDIMGLYPPHDIVSIQDKQMSLMR